MRQVWTWQIMRPIGIKLAQVIRRDGLAGVNVNIEGGARQVDSAACSAGGLLRGNYWNSAVCLSLAAPAPYSEYWVQSCRAESRGRGGGPGAQWGLRRLQRTGEATSAQPYWAERSQRALSHLPWALIKIYKTGIRKSWRMMKINRQLKRELMGDPKGELKGRWVSRDILWRLKVPR